MITTSCFISHFISQMRFHVLQQRSRSQELDDRKVPPPPPHVPVSHADEKEDMRPGTRGQGAGPVSGQGE